MNKQSNNNSIQFQFKKITICFIVTKNIFTLRYVSKTRAKTSDNWQLKNTVKLLNNKQFIKWGQNYNLMQINLTNKYQLFFKSMLYLVKQGW